MGLIFIHRDGRIIRYRRDRFRPTDRWQRHRRALARRVKMEGPEILSPPIEDRRFHCNAVAGPVFLSPTDVLWINKRRFKIYRRSQELRY